MEYFKQLVASAMQYSASHLCCVVGLPPAIRRLGHMEFLQVGKIRPKDMEDMISSLFPPEVRTELNDMGEATVDMEFDGVHLLKVYAVRNTEAPSTETKIIAVIKELTPPSDGDLPPGLLQAISGSSCGAVLLGGAVHHNKDATVGLLLEKIGRAKKKHILAFGWNKPLISAPESSIISSYNKSQASSDFIRNQAADMVVFRGLDHNLINTVHSCVMMGILVVATVDAASTAYMLERVISMFQDRESGTRFLSSHVLGAAFQVFISKRASGPCLYLYDFIRFDQEIKRLIADNNVAQIENRNMVQAIHALIDENQLTHYDAHPILACLIKQPEVQGIGAGTAEVEF
ncbi:MAG: twitching motility protein (pilT) [Anaplasma sp.]